MISMQYLVPSFFITQSSPSSESSTSTSTPSSSASVSSSQIPLSFSIRKNNIFILIFGFVLFIELTACSIHWTRNGMDSFNLTSYYHLSPLSSKNHLSSSEEYFLRKSKNETIFIYLCEKTLAIIEYGQENQIIECELFDLEKKKEIAFKKAQSINRLIENISLTTMSTIIKKCQIFAIDSLMISDAVANNNINNKNNNNTTKESEPPNVIPWSGLIPGTKWCGIGDKANNYDDLGPKVRVDICCRAHDHCPLRLKALRSGYGLTNISIYTKSYCTCDEEFYKCLKQVNTSLSDTMIKFYFDMLGTTCIREDKPTCKKASNIEECIDFNGTTKMKYDKPNLS